MSSQGKTSYEPDLVSPPGETLQDVLEERGLSQAQLAERMGRPKKTINEIIQAKAAITPDTALQLELVLQIPAHFWLAREAKYRASLARHEEHKRIELDVKFLDDLPMKEMINFGWIAKATDKAEMVRNALKFFGVVNSDKIPRLEEVAFRRSQSFATNPWALAAWLRKGELEAIKISTAEYDRERFHKTVMECRALTRKAPGDFVPELTSACAKAGVALVFVRELPKTAVSGATRWLAPNRPMIQLSLRYKCDDLFWFAFFHECGHVLLEHAKREVLLEGVHSEQKVTATQDPREVAANQFAAETLIPDAELATFLQKGTLTQRAIEEFASCIKIAPGILVGRLQHDNHLDWSRFRALKRTFSWDDWPVS